MFWTDRKMRAFFQAGWCGLHACPSVGFGFGRRQPSDWQPMIALPWTFRFEIRWMLPRFDFGHSDPPLDRNTFYSAAWTGRWQTLRRIRWPYCRVELEIAGKTKFAQLHGKERVFA